VKHEDLTKKLIGCFYTVYNALGYGFLESVYQSALAIELRKQGFRVTCQQPFTVHYDGHIVGEFVADIVVDDLIVLELKAVRTLMPEHENQLLNYLNASHYEVGLLFNFGPTPQLKRRIYDNERKVYRVPDRIAHGHLHPPATVAGAV
jgi:GxxExxY protein